MFFLLRAAFWLSLVVLLIPSGEEAAPSVPAARAVSTFEAVGAAHSTYEDLKGFCGRNPDACQTGRAFADTFSAKARHGARWVYDQLEPKDTAPTGSTPSATAGPAQPRNGRPIDGPLPVPRPAFRPSPA
ncbi:DUF5330 domain-containing protein [Siculibacillus lacustris]|uniref:DUF5330 domain-containing protein n=1 Tax=Siculibacillus lacustris TaxID=1549641 RepID=UPI001D197008|nr:DUF5330 domain-containing protein [Siculibacillus lacustris]